jgi:hypothetical protein
MIKSRPILRRFFKNSRVGDHQVLPLDSRHLAGIFLLLITLYAEPGIDSFESDDWSCSHYHKVRFLGEKKHRFRFSVLSKNASKFESLLFYHLNS